MSKSSKPFLATLGGIALLLLVAFAATLGASDRAFAQTEGRTVEEPSPMAGNLPGGSIGNVSDTEMWRKIRRGLQGTVSIPDKNLGIMIQSEGDNWRAWRNGPLTVYGAWGLLGIVALLALFFAVRGRMKVEAGLSGRTVERFNGIERFMHWLTAVSFILLGLTGLNLVYGKHVLLPIIGNEAFSVLSQLGKYVHNFVSFPFMLGLVLMFVLWVASNLPSKYDLVWLSKGGGMFTKGVHPPAERFNAGQKLVFWIVILGGLSLSLSGISLLFPYEFSFFSVTFSALNVFGFGLPTDLAPVHEMQLSQLWHAFVGMIMIIVIIAHIYIGSLGMEGAFAAMGSGQVDENWAREHHNIWYARLGETGHGASGGKPQPAE